MFSFCLTLVLVLQGYTPLHIAALHGHRHILDLLVGTYGKNLLLFNPLVPSKNPSFAFKRNMIQNLSLFHTNVDNNCQQIELKS